MRIEFCLSSLIKKPFEVFWFTQTSFYVHQKTSKGFLIRDAKQSLLRNETQFSQCTTKPSRFTVQNSRKPVKTHCAKSCAFLSLMTTRSVLVFSRKRYIVYFYMTNFLNFNLLNLWTFALSFPVGGSIIFGAFKR